MSPTSPNCIQRSENRRDSPKCAADVISNMSFGSEKPSWQEEASKKKALQAATFVTSTPPIALRMAEQTMALRTAIGRGLFVKCVGLSGSSTEKPLNLNVTEKKGET